VADSYNTRALKAYKQQQWQFCYDLASEAIRLNPSKVAYLGNRAAAALKLSGLKHLRQCVADSKLACRFDPGYAKGYARSAEALYMMGERQTVKESMTLWEKAVELDPCNERYRSSYQNVCLVWEAEYNR